MRIVLQCDGTLPALKYGGTERVVWGLARALTDLGHSVTLLAPAGSTSSFCQVQIYRPDRPIAQQVPDGTDLVHVQNAALPVETYPSISTLHGNAAPDAPRHPNTVYVSQDHARRHNGDCYVYNGLYWAEYAKPNLALPRSHVHFLGRAAWRIKSVRGAIRISRRAGHKLVVMGGTRLNITMGFRLTLARHVSFAGMVDDATKAKVMQASRGLLYPVLWNEPFGLAMIESLYYGAPVFGSARGSLPELIGPDVGTLSNNEADLVAALVDPDPKHPHTCHAYAAEQFCAARMAGDYLNVYEHVLNHGHVPRNLEQTE